MSPIHTTGGALRLEGPGPASSFDRAGWDACVDRAGGFAMFSSVALTAYERGEPGKEPCHLVATRDGHPVAIAPLYVESWSSPHARDMAQRVPQPGELTATGHVRWGVGFAVTSGGPVVAPGDSDGLALLAAHLEAWAAQGTVVGFTNVPHRVDGLGLLEARGWQVVEQDVEHVLDAVPGGVGGHVERLEGSRGRNLRRSLRRLVDEGVTYREATPRDLPLLARLCAEDDEAHGLLRPLVPFSLVETLVTEVPVGDVRIVERRGQVIGYGIGLRGRGGTWLLSAGARAPMVDQVHGLYMDYLGSLPAGGRLFCGRENFVFKDRLGCRRTPMYAAFVAPPGLEQIVRDWLATMLPAVRSRARSAFEGAGFPLPDDLTRGVA